MKLLNLRNRPDAPDPFGLVILDWMLPGMDGIEAARQIRERPATAALPIVVISAYAGKEEEARCAAIGVNVFLPKPITASSLFDAIVEAEGAKVHSKRRSLDVPLEREFAGLRALLAEDNEANQMVALALLGKLGIELDIAVNGREAVEMARANAGRYAAIFMDVQMPEMDGLEATRTLRKDPVFRDIPIIAMTANAMKRDLDECLEAGMSDHVTKPIDRRALVAALRKWLPKSTIPVTAEPPAATAPDTVPTLEGINVADTLDRLGLDFIALKRMLVRFADGQRRTFDDLRTAVAASDPVNAAKHAHAIAGAAGNLGADDLRAAAKNMESAARTGQRELTDLLRAVDERAAILFASIDTLRENAAPVATHSTAPIDPAKLRATLERLASALDAFDLSESDATLKELTDVNGSPLAAGLARVRGLVEGYEYEQAASLVADLLKTLEAGA